MRPELAANLHLWEHWTDLHMSGSFYDVDGFVADPRSRPFDDLTRGVLGDITGRRALHLQCHIGIDTLRLALAGAVAVTGVDFSPKAIAAARSIAARTGLDATFVVADVADLPDEIRRDAFDVVFTSYGTIMWLPDLGPWADSIVTRLARGGRFHIIDAHPFMSVFDDEASTPPLRVRYPYFSTEPQYYREKGSYADRDAHFEADSYFWQHSFEEIVGVLIERGLVIEALREYPVITWPAFDFMTEAGEGLWGMPAEAGEIPLTFSLTARRP